MCVTKPSRVPSAAHHRQEGWNRVALRSTRDRRSARPASPSPASRRVTRNPGYSAASRRPPEGPPLGHLRRRTSGRRNDPVRHRAPSPQRTLRRQLPRPERRKLGLARRPPRRTDAMGDLVGSFRGRGWFAVGRSPRTPSSLAALSAAGRETSVATRAEHVATRLMSCQWRASRAALATGIAAPRALPSPSPAYFLR
jgi:hypothetical protein